MLLERRAKAEPGFFLTFVLFYSVYCREPAVGRCQVWVQRDTRKPAVQGFSGGGPEKISSASFEIGLTRSRPHGLVLQPLCGNPRTLYTGPLRTLIKLFLVVVLAA